MTVASGLNRTRPGVANAHHHRLGPADRGGLVVAFATDGKVAVLGDPACR